MRVENLDHTRRRHVGPDASLWPVASSAVSDRPSSAIPAPDRYDQAVAAPRRTGEIVGYTSGVFDLFHVGHLRILHNAAGLCDRLIVGVSSDELVQYKGKAPIVPFVERMEIVREVKGVSAVVPQYDMDKFAMWQRLKFDIMFVGDDWYGTDKWQQIEDGFTEVGVQIVYFPYTQGTSSTMIANELNARQHVI
jgi:glycerol-3-phosphate cytidylyltransferase